MHQGCLINNEADIILFSETNVVDPMAKNIELDNLLSKFDALQESHAFVFDSISTNNIIS